MKPDQILLAIETSGKSGSVATVRVQDGKPVCQIEILSPDSGSAKTLAPAIERLLHAQQMKMNCIAAIALPTGPGSFTGLRVGVATVKAMAYALKIPTIEVDTLDVIANQCPVASDSVHVVLDAYRGQVFCAEYTIQGYQALTNVEKVRPTEILDIAVLLDRAKKYRDVNAILDFCGPGCDRIRKFLETQEGAGANFLSRLTERVRWIDGPAVIPMADTVGRLGLVKFLAGDVLDPFAIQPRYYRASAAEEVAAKSK